MKTATLLSFIVIALGTLFLSACEQTPGSSDTTADGAMPGMPRQAAQDAAEHIAEGTLNSIDRAAGTVNISHGPVASANWPAMTMSFKLSDPSAAATLTPGQKVEFHFTIESGMSATVTQISGAD